MKYKDFNFNLPHNEDKPDFIWTNRKEWYSNGLHHRINGPAVIWKNGTQEWHLNGKMHRTDGPAKIWSNGNEEWVINGQYITKEVKQWMQKQNVIWPWDEETQAQFLLTFC